MLYKKIKMNSLGSISIIIPNYNGLKYLKDCIDSVIQQTYKNFEIIIIDNASEDKSCEFILENYFQVKIIKLDKNYGFSKAVNEGIKCSSAEFVVLLNNDTIVEKHWLQNLVNCIKNDDRIFSVCSKMMRFYQRDKIDDAGDLYSILGWAHKRGDGSPINKYSYDSEVFSSCGGATIYRREFFDKLGYFDENFFAYLEDIDIGYRSKIQGYKNLYCSKAMVYHIGSATTGSRHNSLKVKLAARNNIYLIYKNTPYVQLIINLPFLILGHIIKYIFFVKKGFGKAYLYGVLEALRNLKYIKRVKFSKKNLINYVSIEFKLIINLFLSLLDKLKLI